MTMAMYQYPLYKFNIKFRMKKNTSITALLFVATLTSMIHAQRSWSPEHVYYGRGGALTYTPDTLGNTIPDFSHVGYRYGDDSIPDIQTRVEVQPVDGDDGLSIQAAIDSVAAMTPDKNGFRGAVLLKAGTYQVSGQLLIGTSGVVLRGEGDSDAGTVIIAEGTSRRDLIKVDNGASRSVDGTTTVAINEAYVPLGRKFVVVSNATGFSEGDQIVLYRPGTAKWISDIKMDQITPSEGTVQWTPSSYSFYFERLITRVSGDTLFFRNPVVMAMETQYGGGTVSKFSFSRLENIGVENICLKSAFQSETDEEHSWNAIAFYSIENGWVRQVTSWYFAYSCVNLQRNSRLITVENCHCREPKSIITGGRRYSFNLVGSLNLFKECSATEGRHDFVSSSRVCGPNVFTACEASKTHADIGPHHRWAMGTLYDVVLTDGQINVQDRDDMGTGHGWAGANQVFWNCKGSSSICQSPWTSAKNYNFGFMGQKNAGARAGRPDGEWVGQNRPGIYPASLYEAQLAQRLNGTSIFSAISQLDQINDSLFRISFTLPLTPSQIIYENFTVGGSAGIDKIPYTVMQDGDYSVLITFLGLGILPTFSTIVVGAGSLTSKDGLAIEGVTEALFTEPDKRPVVSGLELTVDNETGFVEASTSKSGAIYLVKWGSDPSVKSDLDSLVEINLGRMEEAPQPDVSITLYTNGLPAGFYNYYAVDEDLRVSLPGKEWVNVEDAGAGVGMEMDLKTNSLGAYRFNGQVVVSPGTDESYSLEIFSITGALLFRENHLQGVQTIDLPGRDGIILIRKKSPSDVSTIKIN